MALQLGALRDALIEAGASTEKPPGRRRNWRATSEFAEIKGDLGVLKWAQAATFAAVLAVLLRLFLH